MSKPLSYLAPLVLAVAGCANAPAVPPTTPLERFSRLNEDRELRDQSRTFRIEIGQLLGLEEVLKELASRLSITNPDQAGLILAQVDALQEMNEKLPAELIELVEAHTSAAYRTRLEVYGHLNAANINVFNFSEREKYLIERLRTEAGQRGQRVATVKKEIEDLRTSQNAAGFQADISLREEEIREILSAQQAIDGSFIDRLLRGEEGQQLPSDHWERVVYTLALVGSAFDAGSGISPDRD